MDSANIQPLAPACVAPQRLGPRPLGLYYALLSGLAVPQLVPHTLPVLADNPNLNAFLRGVKRYRDYPWQRPQPDYSTIYSVEGMSVLDCGGKAGGAPVLLVPSLINKEYIMDLLPQHQGGSLVSALREAGLRPYLIQWACPLENAHTADHTLSSLCGRLLPAAIEAVSKHSHRHSIHVLGYCMGGILALGAVLQTPKRVESFTAAAMPWDFSHTDMHTSMKKQWPAFELLLNTLNVLPVDLLQTQFVMLDPNGAIKRLQALATVTDSTHLQRMVALEDWLADGLALAAAPARFLLEDCYKLNRPAQGLWRINGQRVRPQALTCRSLCVVPGRDIIVPAASALSFAEQAAGQTLHAPTGHIGLMAGRSAHESFFKPLVEWLKN